MTYNQLPNLCWSYFITQVNFTCGVENRGKSAHNGKEMVVIDEGLTKGLVHRVDVSHCLKNDYINHLFKIRMETFHNQSIYHNCE